MYIGLDKKLLGGIKFDASGMGSIDLDQPEGKGNWNEIEPKLPKSSWSFESTYVFYRDCKTGKPVHENLILTGDAILKN